MCYCICIAPDGCLRDYYEQSRITVPQGPGDYTRHPGSYMIMITLTIIPMIINGNWNDDDIELRGNGPPPHSPAPIFFPSHHHFNMLPSHPAVFHSWTFWSISKHLYFFLSRNKFLVCRLVYISFGASEPSWLSKTLEINPGKMEQKHQRNQWGGIGIFASKKKIGRLEDPNHRHIHQKNWQVWERKFKVVRDVAACLEYRWQGQKLLGENCSRKKFTFSDSKLQGNYHKKQKCFRNREMCFLFQLCSIGAVRLASVFTREWHFPHGHVLTRQIDEEFQAFSLITSFSFCNGIKT